MGVLTRGVLVTEGMLIAGRDDLSARAYVWLQAWLDSVAASWPWPQLKQSATVTLTSGSPSFTVGAGTGGVTQAILRILDNLWVYRSDKRLRQRVRIEAQETEPFSELYINSERKGLPESVRLFASTAGTFGEWVMLFDPTPDEAFLLSLPILAKQAALASDSSIPWYPNDATMMQMIAAECMKYDDGPDSPAYKVQTEQVGAMVTQDRIRFGQVVGINDRIVLDAAVFR